MILETRHLSKIYGNKRAVHDLNLQIEAGSFTAILGPNGAGKSTTIQMLTKLLQPTTGEILYNSNIKLGVVFQNSVLDDMLTVRENLDIRAGQYNRIDKGKVDSLIEQLGLKKFSTQLYGTLSGGQKRRVDIARALLNNPDVLFLDEPTTGLDIQTRKVIWDLIHHLQMKEKMTVILTTHYLDEADDADMIYIVDYGQVIAKGSADQIKEQYAQNFLKVFVTNSADFKEIMEGNISFEEVRPNEFLIHPETTGMALGLLTRGRSFIRQFEFRPGTMDDAFMALTGREVR
ncbi:Daunorubicin/doxorubicin resistance ATP-binding protein DrrA [Streptococcus intermedius]|jgi:ABC-type multidrug transport system, ATPase component, putative|uniref:ABC transporter ATP-binding protein n=1 Tax=Streptococcus intermedius TaxID=1338 RepID=UPI00029C6BA1|nr:ABC transporter ATP-binding protein [Streptococcus intermedius]EKU17815.1 ABC transporter family protein [Streptococcus intermedius BA1]PMR92027.1 ABC transporter ATP-binding protein [Streptococcus intermedius]RSJ09278.1 Daunorubicin/doxorubicin resistance ATP-binding protein DrrA [Streptococcus intermedius]RSJ11783.1 Daunorubicin/doxorubicin resistance ATP-binding protein DrrA [Streptococcus intermedius]RSJ15008.1 Daunorubicin/doxorubicin resistance ATP-binding protein DrrA [Streptococcus 